MDLGVFRLSSHICLSAVRVIMIVPPPLPPPPPAIVSPFGCLFGSLCRCAPFAGCVEASQHCWLIGGNAFVSGYYWASAALSSGVMVHAGRCYKSRFGGAILLTRSLLRQAASNSAEKRAISSTGTWQTAGDVLIAFFLIEYDAEW